MEHHEQTIKHLQAENRRLRDLVISLSAMLLRTLASENREAIDQECRTALDDYGQSLFRLVLASADHDISEEVRKIAHLLLAACNAEPE